jgi:hypothetical protein
LRVDSTLQKRLVLLVSLSSLSHDQSCSHHLDVVLPIALTVALRYKATAAPGWTSVALHQASVPWSELWESVLLIRNEQVSPGPPLDVQADMQAVPFQSEGDFLDEELSTIITAWLEEKREEKPGSSTDYFPAADVRKPLDLHYMLTYQIDQYCSQYLLSANGQAGPRAQQTKERLTAARRELASNF